MDETHIDWGSASVEDGQLTVAFAGKPSREWRERVQSVLEQLHHGGSAWGAIAVGKKKVAADEDTGDEDDERSAADQRMTDAFRGFAADDD